MAMARTSTTSTNSFITISSTSSDLRLQKPLSNSLRTISLSPNPSSSSSSSAPTSQSNQIRSQLNPSTSVSRLSEPTSSHSNNPTKRIKVGARASIACETCRRRKARCSGEYPFCSFCATRNLRCDYDGHPDDLTNSCSNRSNPKVSSSPSCSRQSLNESSVFQTKLSNNSLSLPPQEIINDVIDTFITHFSDEGLFTFFNRHSLSYSLEMHQTNPELLLVIISLAGRFCDSLKALHGGNSYTTCNLYASQALNILRSDPDQISLARVQAYLMLGFYDCAEQQEKRGWMSIGMAIRMAQLMRLANLDDDEDQPSAYPTQQPTDSGHQLQNLETALPLGANHQSIISSDLTNSQTNNQQEIEMDIRRRTFWSCFLIERLFSDGKDRPVMISCDQDDINTHFPDPEYGFSTGRRPNLGALTTSPTPPWGPISSKFRTSQSNGTTTNCDQETDLFGQTMRIADLWNKVLKYISRGGRNHDRRCPWLPDSSFSRLDEQLSEWETRLPSHLQSTESNLVAYSIIGQGKSYGLMHLLYFSSLLYLHRDYIPFLPPLNYNPKDGPIDGQPLWHPAGNFAPPNPDWWKTSTEICFRSANAITDMITNLRYRGASLTNPFAGFSILTAGTMHIHQWFWPGSFSIVKNAREYLSVDTRILNNLKKTWSISHQWCKVLNTQYALNSLIKDNDSSTTVVTQPLNLIRASLMKIINTQFNVNPGETVKVTARPKFDGTNQVLNLKERVNEVDEIGEGAAVEISDKKMDFSQSSVAEIVRMKHDIFAQAWPEPRLLQDDSHSFVGINHRRQQQEQEHMFRGSSDEVVVARAEGQDSHHVNFQISTAGDAASHFVHHDGHSSEPINNKNHSGNRNDSSSSSNNNSIGNVIIQRGGSIGMNYSGNDENGRKEEIIEFGEIEEIFKGIEGGFGGMGGIDLNCLSDWNAINFLTSLGNVSSSNNNH